MDLVNTVIDGWRQFMEFEFAHEVLMSIGAFMILTSIFRILKASFRLVIWVAMLILGGMAFSYGVNETTYEVPMAELSDLTDLGSSISMDTLRLLCSRFTN